MRLNCDMMNFLVIAWLLGAAVRPPAVEALYAEDAGRLDFILKTAGHGPVQWAFAVPGQGVLLTSDRGPRPVAEDSSSLSAATPSLCILASRRFTTGQLLWRRDLCTSSSAGNRHHLVTTALVSTPEMATAMVMTLDTHSGTLRAWHVEHGQMIWESLLPPSNEPVQSLMTVSASLSNQQQQQQDYVILASGNENSMVAVVDASTGNFVLTDTISPELFERARRGTTPDPFTARMVTCAKAQLMIRAAGFALRSYRTSQEGKDDNDATSMMVQFTPPLLSPQDMTQFISLVDCTETAATVFITSRRGTSALVQFAAQPTAESIAPVILWKAEEGLAHISHALMLDESHVLIHPALDEDQDPESTVSVDHLLRFDVRLRSQLKAWQARLAALWPSAALVLEDDRIGASRRDHLFGFVKTAVLLSPMAHRIMAVHTAGMHRSQIRYVLDLPLQALAHDMIHGHVNARHHTHGLHGASHSRDVLVLSYLSSTTSSGDATTADSVHWTCFDASHGQVQGEGKMALAAPVVQRMPLSVTSGSCRQAAVLLLEDRSVVVVPDQTESAQAAFSQALQSSSQNGFFTHRIRKESPGGIESYRLQQQGSSVSAVLVGSTVFTHEHVVSVTYPSREESIQSPCNVLGDDSLLLKYLNPHIAVFITMKDDDHAIDEPSDFRRLFSVAIKSGSKKGQQKRKPIGVSSKRGASTETTPDVEVPSDPPNLFVNVVDTVSGRLLHRTNHAQAVSSPRPTVVMSENWIFYTFVNKRTRRAELGVLSLYEGMIDSKGLTAFSAPEQTGIFSSLDARESKPVVLAKTYSLAKPCTAMGMTASREGISTQRLLLAGADGQIMAVDRQLLEPRRPVGQIKDSEKKEGLRQYSELVPTVTLMALSYNQTVEGVTNIITAPTHLESQTLVLAFGGPDIFFSRTSPSRGFDVLPDGFNRILLSIVLFASLAALGLLRRTASKKIVKQGWS